MDNLHKVATFIIKNPPEKEIEAQGESVTKKKDRKDKKKDGSDEDQVKKRFGQLSFLMLNGSSVQL